ncbi:hypothetical protein CALVIDRAFT_505159, partial [Calocera viscosa TUFC12733]
MLCCRRLLLVPALPYRAALRSQLYFSSATMLGPVPFSSHRDKPVSTINAKRSDLTVSFSEWKAKLGEVLDPMKEKVEQATYRVFGIWDEVQKEQADCEELASELSWVAEQILGAIPPSGLTDAKVQRAVNALATAALNIDDFIKQRPSTKEVMGKGRAKTIAKFLTDVKEMR